MAYVSELTYSEILNLTMEQREIIDYANKELMKAQNGNSTGQSNAPPPSKQNNQAVHPRLRDD